MDVWGVVKVRKSLFVSLFATLIFGVLNVLIGDVAYNVLGMDKEEFQPAQEKIPQREEQCLHFNGSSTTCTLGNSTGDHQLTLKLKGKTAIKQITEVHQNSFEDLKDEIQRHASKYKNISFGEALHGREKIWEILVEAGIQQIDVPTLLSLPTWDEVKTTYGDGPIIHGLETCETFQNTVPRNDSFVGVAGFFNTGTNALALYLKGNLRMPENPQMDGGILTTVPWHKHWFPSYRWNYTEKLYYKPGGQMEGFHSNRANILPIVIVRDPYTWMQSMCSISYDVKWIHNKKFCPNFNANYPFGKSGGVPHAQRSQALQKKLAKNRAAIIKNNAKKRTKVYKMNKKRNTEGNNRRLGKNDTDISKIIGDQSAARINHNKANSSQNDSGRRKNFVRFERLNPRRKWDSIIHLWNEWYNEYLHADFPRLIVRFEDLLFHAKDVINTVQQCAGATFIEEDSFAYVVDRSKYEQDGVKYQTNMVSAMIKHATISRRYRGLADDDLEYTRDHVDPQLMKLFSYPIKES